MKLFFNRQIKLYFFRFLVGSDKVYSTEPLHNDHHELAMGFYHMQNVRQNKLHCYIHSHYSVTQTIINKAKCSTGISIMIIMDMHVHTAFIPSVHVACKLFCLLIANLYYLFRILLFSSLSQSLRSSHPISVTVHFFLKCTVIIRNIPSIITLRYQPHPL